MSNEDYEIRKLIHDARQLNDEDARNLILTAIEKDKNNAKLWCIYGSWFEVTSDEAIRAYAKALDLDPNSLDDHPQGALLARLARKNLPNIRIIDPLCLYCTHYSAGHVDRQKNWFRCDVKHRLIDIDPFGAWEDRSNGDGEPMIKRSDCTDWKFSGSRFYVPPDPWWG